jgi:DNA-binding NarL/FixJ family response regulator
MSITRSDEPFPGPIIEITRMTHWGTSDRKVEVVLIEDHDDYRNSLEFFLNGNGRVNCRSFPDAETALRSLELFVPDLVIMDIHLPGMDGIACTRILRDRFSKLQVLICTVHEDDERIFNALRAGAAGYLLKRAPIDELIEAIRQVLTGGSPMSPAIARRVVSSFRPRKYTDDLNALSEREQEVLELLCEDWSSKEIGEKLFVSANTVRTHIRHIYEKLQVQSRVEAVNKVRGK